MRAIEVMPFKAPVTKSIIVPASKSYTNRALLMAALTQEDVHLYHPLYCEDTQAMISCLRALGLRIETLPEKIIIYDDISVIQPNIYQLYAHDSGTTLRFLLALVCLVPGTKVLEGSAGLSTRPVQDLVKALQQLGAEIHYLDKVGQLPLRVTSSHLLGGEVRLDASVSSQYLSSLLMIAPYLAGLKISLLGKTASKPYVEMSINTMRDWGIKVQTPAEGVYEIPAGQRYQKKEYMIEGDYSSAGYFFAIAALTQSTLTLKNLNPNSVQADRNFLKLLAQMGNEITVGENAITIRGKQILPGCFNMEDCPDQVQTMAVLAAFANGITKISGVRSLRVKETERVYALKSELAKMGIKTEDTEDSLTIYGGQPHAAAIDTYGDHRMAMAFAIAGTKLAGMKINQPHVVNKTFPAFWETLDSLHDVAKQAKL
jgi:3-phosphoshikimate 1-carboxyvinyltransferase